MKKEITKHGLRILREEINGFQIWETIPRRNHIGGVMREVGDAVTIDGETYTVTDLAEAGARCQITAKRVVDYETVAGKRVHFTTTKGKTALVSLYKYP
tara:strand:- start:4195 stop:4491 length:297 start_codon:yes stop_codon:yes gene_type:complete